eukprot:Phypoly_transcript_13134.p1 GENE.Phypoly_transcript_13134~~Phypoly_transcript_13134.p1  ORF type:complete len:268 (+),score=12.70 Phypoly_transcript_13134:114-917(+)
MNSDEANLDALLAGFKDQIGGIKNHGPQQRGICAHCNKPIFGELVEAGGKRYHPEHHQCRNCGKPISDGTYYEPNNETWCEPCFQSMHVAKCFKCKQNINDKIINAMNKTWHYHHFTCEKCGDPLGDKEFFIDGDKAYCKKDYRTSFVQQCHACHKHIKGAMVTAGDKHYCEQCFKCHHPGCGIVLGGLSFYDQDSKPYCEKHYQDTNQMICPCGRGIGLGQYASALDRKWHPECFICDHCKKQLIGLSFAESNGKAFCVPCYERLF